MQNFFEPIKELRQNESLTHVKILCVRYNLILAPFALQVQMSWNQAHAPVLIKSFPRAQRTQFEASKLNGSHNYKTKQNKPPSFIDRLLVT
jgi:hypothetical protein